MTNKYVKQTQDVKAQNTFVKLAQMPEKIKDKIVDLGGVNKTLKDLDVGTTFMFADGKGSSVARVITKQYDDTDNLLVIGYQYLDDLSQWVVGSERKSFAQTFPRFDAIGFKVSKKRSPDTKVTIVDVKLNVKADGSADIKLVNDKFRL